MSSRKGGSATSGIVFGAPFGTHEIAEIIDQSSIQLICRTNFYPIVTYLEQTGRDMHPKQKLKLISLFDPDQLITN